MYRNPEHYPDPTAGAALNGIEVEQHLLRVHWRYNVDGLLKKLEGDKTNESSSL